MVWIHGGAFEIGSTAEPREEGTNFVKENPDVILVSVEYRLGVFGFFHLSHLPDGGDYPDAQNLGLLDQVMALKARLLAVSKAPLCKASHATCHD